MERSKKISLTWKAVVGLVVIILFFNAVYTIPEGYRGVVTTFGKVSGVAEPGINMKVPIMQGVKGFEVRTQKYSTDAISSSSDLQQVKTTIAVQYFVNPENVDDLYSQYGSEYRKRIIYPAVQEVVKASTAKYTASELITKRQDVKDLIVEGMTERMSVVNINMENVDIVDFQFSQAFSDAIEQKVKAQQEALREQNRLEQVKFQAQQKIEQAQAEAEAIRIKAQAITQQGGRDYVMLQAVEKWSGNLPEIMPPNGTVPFIPIDIGR